MHEDTSICTSVPVLLLTVDESVYMAGKGGVDE